MHAKTSLGFEVQILCVFIKGIWIILTFYVDFVAVTLGYGTYFGTKVTFQLILEVNMCFKWMWFSDFCYPCICGAFIKKLDKHSRNGFQVNTYTCAQHRHELTCGSPMS
jgi:hypothetical protein